MNDTIDSRPAKKRHWARLPWFLAILLASFMLAGSLGKLFWALDLASHYRLQYCYGAALLIGWFALVKAWRGLAFSLVLLVLAVIPVFALAAAPPKAIAGVELPVLRLFFANVHTANTRYARLLELVKAEQPDLVLLEELDASWLRGIASLEQSYPHKLLEPRPDNFGIGLYSKLPLAQAELVRWGSPLPTIVARLTHAAKQLTLILSHPVPPMSAAGFEMRNRQLRELARQAKLRGAGTILIGDLNCTPWSAIWPEFLKSSGLRDSTQGFGPQPSWPSYWPAFCRIPIDHCLHSADLIVTNRRLGPKFGSDHLPLIVELR